MLPPVAALLAKGARDHPWRQWSRLESYFATGQVCVIDGANGTEIQRRGGRPAETFSSGTAALARPDLCQEVHQAYLDAGADVIITHTYSANGNVMGPSGNGGRVSECILCAAAIARRACLHHVATYAAQLAHSASASAAAAAHTAAAASTSAARATTSLMSNESASVAALSSVNAVKMAADATALALHAMQEVHACAAAANAAASASLAASEGGKLLEATTPVIPPDPVATQGWDSSGFGPAMVVGSLSTHPPEMPPGMASSAEAKWPEAKVEEERYFEAAQAHALSGVDMLWLEMMKDEHAFRAVRAAAASGLPVFLGISARTDPTSGRPVLWGNGADAEPLNAEWFRSLSDILGENLVGVNVMHTNFSTMADTLRFVREDCGWTGPLGAYPDHGVFEAPNWVFYEIDNGKAVEYVQEWIDNFGVQLVGGCCGLGPEYITALSAQIRRHNAAVRQKRATVLPPYGF